MPPRRGRSASPARKRSLSKKAIQSRQRSKSRSRSKSKTVKSWLTHDNGGRPFKVEIKKNRALIYDNYSNQTPKPLMREFNITDHIIGKSPLTPQTKFSGGYGAKFDGNTILLKLANSPKWVFVGDSIFEFKPLSEIVSYVSEVGNNDVSYPYAIDSEGRTYLLGQGAILTKDVPLNFKNDPYGYYYNYWFLTPEEGKSASNPGFKNIQKYWYNNSRSKLDWQPIRNRKAGTHHIKYIGQAKRVPMSDEEMAKLNRAFGKQRGFRNLVTKTLVKRRW